MRWSTLDSIVKGLLIKQGKPIHWYMQYLKYACDAVRELNYDSLRSIHTEKLTVTKYKAIILPCKYVDWVRVGVQVNDKVKSLTQSNTLNRLNNYNTDGSKIPYPFKDTTSGNPYYNDFQLRRNSYDEFTGGIFNNRADWNGSNFRVVPERDEIQFDSDFPFSEVILEYIGDGLDGDAATRVDAYAIDTIESYIAWQVELHDRRSSMGVIDYKKGVYDKAHRILRARKNAMSKDDIINSYRKGNSGTYKN